MEKEELINLIDNLELAVNDLFFTLLGEGMDESTSDNPKERLLNVIQNIKDVT